MRSRPTNSCKAIRFQLKALGSLSNWEKLQRDHLGALDSRKCHHKPLTIRDRGQTVHIESMDRAGGNHWFQYIFRSPPLSSVLTISYVLCVGLRSIIWFQLSLVTPLTERCCWEPRGRPVFRCILLSCEFSSCHLLACARPKFDMGCPVSD
jgi:hypothetical protein